MNPPSLETRRPLVLIADDDELMRSLMAAALSEKGFDTIEAEDGEKAIAMVGTASPDLVLLDVNMPAMNGFEACSQIRRLPGGKELPVVIVTGNEDTDSINAAYDCGATDFISKPVNWSLIGHRMRYVLRGALTRKELTSSEARNRAMLEALPDRLIMLDQAGSVRSVIEQSDAQRSPPDSYADTPLEALLPGTATVLALDHLSTAVTSGKETSFEFSDRDESEKTRYFEVRILPQPDRSALLILRNITPRKLAEQKIHQLAFYDELTLLPNRNCFIQHSESALSSLKPKRDRYLLCRFNLDHFKRINDTLGHAVGDDALRQLGDRLTNFRDRWSDTGRYLDIARLGSDEFALLCSLGEADDSNVILQALLSEFDVPVTCDRHQLIITFSAGTAVFPEDGQNIENLLRSADKALSSAKAAGRNVQVAYDPQEHERSSDTLHLESDLRAALQQDQLALHFQPKFDLRSGALLGAEALLRWEHPEQGMISPGTFIPMAEETGLIVDIDRWVMDRACRHLRDWRTAGLAQLPVSINLSGREFNFDRPEITLQRILDTNGVDPSLIELEITETVLMADPSAAAVKLAELKAMGIRLAVDDFGTGYSSLGYLKRFPLDVLKIDREFVRDLDHDENDRTLCRAMISMARGLGLEVVAEGIETREQHDFLRFEGCQVGQGFLLAKPLPVEAYEAMLAETGLVRANSSLLTGGLSRSAGQQPH